MEKTYFVVDIDRCWGCKACQVACKYEHGIPASEGKPVEVMRVECLEENGAVSCEFLPVSCQHCRDAKCMEVCPRGAIRRDGEGLVQLVEENCVGCGLCIRACPYGAVHFRQAEGKKKVWKCDLCVRRRAKGLPASCEQHCLGGVFHSCPQGEMEELVARRKYRWSAGQVIYVSDRISSLGQGLSD